MLTMAIVVAVVGHNKPKLLEKGVVGEVMLAVARESNRNFAGAREIDSLGVKISGPFFFLFFLFFVFGAVRGRSLAPVDVRLSCRL
jgi:hypothetical protein